MSDLELDGVKIPAWARKTALMLAYMGIKVLEVARYQHGDHVIASLSVQRRVRAMHPFEFAKVLRATFHTIGLQVVSYADLDKVLDGGAVHIRAEYDGGCDMSAVFIFGLEDLTFPTNAVFAAWMAVDVDAAPAPAVEQVTA